MTRISGWLEHALTHNVDVVVTAQELTKRLETKKQLRIKFGVDVTNPLIHIGHGVNLWKMREFQEEGHKVLFLIGDFTSRIGDPTGKSKTRPERSREEIERDAEAYIDQVTKILLRDPAVFEVRRNSEWYDRMSLHDFLKLCGKVTHARLLQRDMFQKRIHEGSEIYMHEVLYPILQGYDSYMLESDLTIVGGDQLFNEMLGRHYQELFGQPPQIVMTTVITPGLDGKEKQSKSLGNFIGITDAPNDMYGKVMTLPDNLIIQYYRVYTQESDDRIRMYEEGLSGGMNPRDVKMRLAHDLVSLYHGKKAAEEAEEQFIRVFQKKDASAAAEEVSVASGTTLLEFLKTAHGSASNSEARRLIQGGAVTAENAVLDQETLVFTKELDGKIIKVGKRRFYKINIE